jgi:hypothetical protein
MMVVVVVVVVVVVRTWYYGIKGYKKIKGCRKQATDIIKNKDKTCLLTDVAIPSDKNVIQKEDEKKLKYKNLSIEIQRTGQHSIDSLQKLPY